MMTVQKDTTLVGVSEMRTKMDEILAMSHRHTVIIEKRHKPVAVLIDAGQYEQLEKRLELLEDFALAHLAKARERGSKGSDYMDIEAALKIIRRQ